MATSIMPNLGPLKARHKPMGVIMLPLFTVYYTDNCCPLWITKKKVNIEIHITSVILLQS